MDYLAGLVVGAIVSLFAIYLPTKKETINQENQNDQWLVAEQYFKDNFEEIK